MERETNGFGPNGGHPVKDEIGKTFWDDQAEKHGTSDVATAPDHYYRILEIEKIKGHLRGPNVLDVGCGNGYSTLQFKEANPDWDFTGLDFSEKMIQQAVAADTEKQVNFIVGDVRRVNIDPFDCIVSERCLINLKTWEEQQKALLNLKDSLKPGGRIILVENFMDGLKNLNALRASFDLHEIDVRWHNRYLEAEEFYAFAEEHFHIKFAENIGNLYYIISRVVYAAIAKLGGGEPVYDHPINQIAAGFPALGNYNFSPNMLFVLEAK